ncbi:sorbin and SH3 domain-containing protein 2-like [Centruroides vittatus]|uniref:sorbin and SH3 domain-containing protein 2-like n=1 Tax=Centruroides vittatus TaxID=120091 RepID=UPI0035108CC5
MQPKRTSEGIAKVKYNFQAKSSVELSLFKGEKVVLTRRVDSNWYEGRIGNKKGIFPLSYIEVIKEPDEINLTASLLCKSPSSSIFNTYMNGVSSNQQLHILQDNSQDDISNGINKMLDQEERPPLTQSLHIDTTNEPIPYKVLYNYKPQNEDELELQERDTVYVLEKCDDGWYVGTSLRTGLFGTFPGNYVERM